MGASYKVKMYPVIENSCKDVFSFDSVPKKEEIFKDLSSSESEIDELKEIINKENSLEDIEKLVGECSTLLRHVKEKSPHTDSKQIMENLSKVEFGLELLRQRLMSSAFYLLNTQEYSEVVKEEEEANSADPSVEFFGLEWRRVFRRCYKLGVELRLLKAGVEQGRMCVDRLCSCLSLVRQLTAEAQMHAHAIQTGRLSSNNLSLQLKQQTVAQLGRTASFNNKSSNSSQSTLATLGKKSIKYKGSRTDSSLILSGYQQSVDAKKIGGKIIKTADKIRKKKVVIDG